MEKAILPVLKDVNGTYTFPTGQLRVVDLFCDGVPVNSQEVIVNNAFAEFATYATGRVLAVKLTSECGTAYVLSNKKNIDNLKNCCNETINYQVNLGCVVALNGSVSVIDVLGNNLGSVTTPAAYVALWNTSIANSYIGKLYERKGWTFTLNASVGSYKLPVLACTASQPVYVCPVATVTSTAPGNIHVVFAAGAQKSYYVHVYTNANGTGEITGVSIPAHPYTNGSTNPQPNATDDFNGLAGGTYYVEVREAGSPTSCTVHTIVVAAIVVPSVSWAYFADNAEPLQANYGSITFPHTQNHTNGQDASLDITDMPVNTWVLFKYPAAEADYLSWVNDINNYGAIPDSNFKAAVTVGSNKYIKSQVALTLTTTQPLLFKHTV